MSAKISKPGTSFPSTTTGSGSSKCNPSPSGKLSTPGEWKTFLKSNSKYVVRLDSLFLYLLQVFCSYRTFHLVSSVDYLEGTHGTRDSPNPTRFTVRRVNKKKGNIERRRERCFKLFATLASIKCAVDPSPRRG